MPMPAAQGRNSRSPRESVRLQEQTFDLTRRQFEGGRGTALETGQAGAQLEQVRASLPDARGAAAARHFPARGPDRPPAGGISAPKCGLRAASALAAPIPVGDGASLLARRPTSARPSANLLPPLRGRRRHRRPLSEDHARRLGWLPRHRSAALGSSGSASASALVR